MDTDISVRVIVDITIPLFRDRSLSLENGEIEWVSFK